jgi:hypothetical protein
VADVPNPQSNIPMFIRRLMPEATEAQLREATETFLRYMAVVIRIHERSIVDNDSQETAS